MLAIFVSLLTLGQSPPDRFAGIDDAVHAAIVSKEIPGAVVVVVHRDRVVFRKAFGNRTVNVPMTLDTLFDLASLTKPIATALAILLLHQDGALNVEDPIAKHLSQFRRKETESITIAHLLTHTGGFIADNALKDYLDGPDAAWMRICALNPTQKPGSKFVYSDVGFIVLGKIVESTAKLPLDEFAKKRIFEPIGMKETGFRPQGELRKRAAPTEKRKGEWMLGEVHDPRAYHLGGVAGHAGLFSTADDLAQLSRVLLKKGTPIFKRETFDLMTKPRVVSTAKSDGLRSLGWDVATAYSLNRGDLFSKTAGFGHTGFTGTSIWIDPPSETAVIFLSNRVHPDGKGNVTKLRSRVATLAAAGVAREK